MKKSRAQQDAERLAALEAEQGRIDSGEISVEEAQVETHEGGDAPLVETPRQPRVEPESQPVAPDVEELQRQIANMKRTLSHYEQELNPAQRRAQQLEREVETLRAQLAETPKAPEGPTDYGLSEEEAEFETVTSIAEKVSKTNNAKLLKEIERLSQRLNELSEEKNQNKIELQIAKHRSDLSKALGGDNPDDYFSHPKMPQWAENQTEEESRALYNPAAYSAKFVAGILTRFKAEVMRGQAKREPSHGEAGIPSRVTPDVIVPLGNQPNEPRFNPDTFQSDVNKLIQDGKTDQAQRLVQIAERAMSA